ncbi:MAG: integrase [Nocardia sp.]|uniref:tyrosine-type recombinase/integrase n=1 Tax=Nocardia sp. TaxID=1821 RepID=UPI0034523A99|nr:integrase [Nocardia sp.]
MLKHSAGGPVEPACDEFGLPIPADPNRPNGRKKQVQQQETYPNREAAEARRDELNAARHTTGTSALAEARKAGDLPFGYYAKAWLDSLQVKVKQGRLKQNTLDGYEANLQRYALKMFSSKAIAAITPHDCEEFLAALVRQKSRQGADGQLDNTLSPATVKHGWGTFRRVLKYAVRHDAIPSNPADRVDFDTNRATGDHEGFEHNPLTAERVARLSATIAGELVTTPSGAASGTSAIPSAHRLPGYPIYGLMVSFLAYTGLRASENAGLEVRDLEFHIAPNVIRCTVHVRRTKTRKSTGTPGKSEWVTSTPKSKRSKRSVPLPACSAAVRLSPWRARQRPSHSPRSLRGTDCALVAKSPERRRLQTHRAALRGPAGLVSADGHGRVLRHHFPPRARRPGSAGQRSRDTRHPEHSRHPGHARRTPA